MAPPIHRCNRAKHHDDECDVLAHHESAEQKEEKPSEPLLTIRDRHRKEEHGRKRERVELEQRRVPEERIEEPERSERDRSSPPLPPLSSRRRGGVIVFGQYDTPLPHRMRIRGISLNTPPPHRMGRGGRGGEAAEKKVHRHRCEPECDRLRDRDLL